MFYRHFAVGHRCCATLECSYRGSGLLISLSNSVAEMINQKHRLSLDSIRQLNAGVVGPALPGE